MRVPVAASRQHMYSAERRQEILALIAKRSRVSVDHLAGYFGVSHSSIRRDLSHLHEDGLITWTYGGAVALNGINIETPFNERKVANFDEKDRIGKVAAALIQDGETIFVDGGTTTECMIVTYVTVGKHPIGQK